ncbi:MAG TPA: ABC transporter ATP-binding protein [Candidatus Paceibacterota bacterium]|nr:ABC transporter ATP-binding protein [Candidatus Paceibacterota bacterium]
MATDFDSTKHPRLQLTGLERYFRVHDVNAKNKVGLLRAVDGVSLQVNPGETLGIVGESGCGKSTLARLAVGLLTSSAGNILIDGQDIWASGAEGRRRRQSLQMVFQNSAGALDPRRTISSSIAEPLRARGIKTTDQAVDEILGLVGLDPTMSRRLPHELSGGQQQRACIARALIAEPALIVLDEAVASLDVSLQAQILNLLVSLQERLGVSYMFISHDLAAVQVISHRVAVMYLGEVVESAPVDEFVSRPQHPYSVALRQSALLPDPVLERNRKEIILQGDVPSPLNVPTGCRFHTRCPIAQPRCSVEKPVQQQVGNDHLVACHFPGQLSPEIAPMSSRPRSILEKEA